MNGELATALGLYNHSEATSSSTSSIASASKTKSADAKTAVTTNDVRRKVNNPLQQNSSNPSISRFNFFFSSSLTKRQNKLERLSLASLAGKARSLPEGVVTENGATTLSIMTLSIIINKTQPSAKWQINAMVTPYAECR